MAEPQAVEQPPVGEDVVVTQADKSAALSIPHAKHDETAYQYEIRVLVALPAIVAAHRQAAERRGAERMREKAAQVVDAGQETYSSTRDGDTRCLTPRSHGNQAGMAYAAAIRAIDTGGEGGKP